MPDLKIEMIEISSLKPWANNARTHSNKQVGQIADSIREFGFTNPVLIDEADNILAGHGRIEAAKLLGMRLVPCVILPPMSEAKKRAYVLADNKLALNAGWDEDVLALELKGLMEMETDFNIELTGFSMGEVDMVIEQVAPEEPCDPADDMLPGNDENLLDVRPGDVYGMGDSRLICANALDVVPQ